MFGAAPTMTAVQDIALDVAGIIVSAFIAFGIWMAT
jgi:hypothetical protein